ncbi:MAG: CopG family transcriptional regulator [Bryobacteraceae bacterium]
MKTRLRNVTITLEEPVARWARIEAAKGDTSVSRLLAGILKEHMREENTYESAMRRALARKPFLKTDGRYLSRDEAHERSSLR